MSYQQLKKKTEGFTIIEVLIVLAIAGLIMLIVFLAVPALQRNGRNTQRQNDVQAVLGAVSEFQSNNNGKIPTTPADQTTAAGNARLGYYDAIAWAAGAQGALATTSDTVRAVTGAKCSTATTGATVAGSSRQVAIQFHREGSGGLNPACQDS